jgi:hypothetical protein
MSDFGEIRSAVESGNYERMLGIYPGLAGKYQSWLFAKCPWMKPDGFGHLHDALVDVQQGQWFKVAAVVYVVLSASDEHREHWMYYAMAALICVENRRANASDVVWWMCSAATDLHQRILHVGYECEWLLVVELLAFWAGVDLSRLASRQVKSPAICLQTSFGLPVCRPYVDDMNESYFEDIWRRHELGENVESCVGQDWSLDEGAWEVVVLNVRRYGKILMPTEVESVACYYADMRKEIRNALNQLKTKLGHL